MKIIKFLFSFGLSILQTLGAGYVLSKYWAWFVVTAFASAPALSYMRCIGLAMFTNLMLMGLYMKDFSARVDQKTDDLGEHLTKSITKSLAYLIVIYPLALLTGWIWHQFIR